MSGAAEERRQRGPKHWSLVIAGGVLTLAVTAGVVLAINLLLGRSLEEATSSLGVAIIGLGPYIGGLVRAKGRRTRE